MPPSPHNHAPSSPHSKAFTLAEILTVMSIIAILAVLVLPALSQNDAKKFSSAVNDISTVLDQARTSAMATNTYVWVGIQPASNSGESGIAITAVSSLSGEADLTTTNLRVLLSPRLRSQVAFASNQSTALQAVNLNSGGLSFVQNWKGEPMTFDPVIQFSPRGEATVTSGAQSRWVQFDLVPIKGNTQLTDNRAVVRLNGVTGHIVVNR